MTSTTLSAAPGYAPVAVATVVAHPVVPAPGSRWIDRPLSHRTFEVAMAFLAVGVLVAIITTSDPLWWQLHFSQLGTFGDLSARTFNSTVIVAGLLLSCYGILLGADLPVTVGRRTSRGIRWSLISAGAHMIVVGIVPIPIDEVMHDRAAAGLALSFLALIASAFGLRGVTRRFRGLTIICVVLLAVGMTALITGVINLASYEAIAFGTVAVWVTYFNRMLRDAPVIDEALPAIALDAVTDEIAVHVPLRSGRHVALRGTVRRSGAAANRSITARNRPRRSSHPRAARSRARGRSQSRARTLPRHPHRRPVATHPHRSPRRRR
jgi:hypothetical membrane protein